MNTPAPAATAGDSGAAPARQIWWAQTRIELILTLRRGESVLLTFAIPMVFLAFFSLVDVLPTGTSDPVDFLLPGILALAVMSTDFNEFLMVIDLETKLPVGRLDLSSTMNQNLRVTEDGKHVIFNRHNGELRVYPVEAVRMQGN